MLFDFAFDLPKIRKVKYIIKITRRTVARWIVTRATAAGNIVRRWSQEREWSSKMEGRSTFRHSPSGNFAKSSKLESAAPLKLRENERGNEPR